MNWDAIGAVSEGLSAVAVVVSLLYLAVQVRQSNRQAQASAETDWMSGWNTQVKGMAADREIVTTMRKGLSDFVALPNNEKVIFQQQMAALTNQWMLGRNLHQRGLLDAELYRGVTSVLVSFYSTPGGFEMFQQTVSGIPYADELLALARAGETPTFTDQYPWWSAD